MRRSVFSVGNFLMLLGHSGEWQLVENGPGTGQLMFDLSRVLKRFEVMLKCSSFFNLFSFVEGTFQKTKVSLHLVEVSDTLLIQQESLLCEKSSHFVSEKPYIRCNQTRHGFPIYWYRTLDDVPAKVNF